MVYSSVADLVGNTPLLRLSAIEKKLSLKGKLFAKVEALNPGGSIKDRVALSMIDNAEEKGLLKEGSIIIEPTSGNTGIGLSMVASARGYKCIIVMPDSMSKERILLMKAFGAEVVLTPGSLGMKGAIAEAERLNKLYPDSFIPAQFDNPSNPAAHYKTTGPEIYNSLDGDIDIFISAVGTGGTITGCGSYLKEHIPSVKVIAVEPDRSPLLSEGKAGPHKIQGIGANFVPAVLDLEVIDEILRVKDEEAFDSGRMLAKTEGLMCGISSGAALSAAIKVAAREENRGKNIVLILPDTGDRYLSTEMYSD